MVVELSVGHDLLESAYAATTRVVDALVESESELGSGSGFARPTRAAGWTVRDLVFHQLCDAQRALIALASPAERGPGSPDVDAVTYWAPWKPPAPGAEDSAASAHADYVRRAAAAYSTPAGLVDQWRATSGAVVRAITAHSGGNPVVATQGHLISVADLASTLVVEATVHLLDLVVGLDAAGPEPACLAHTREVLRAIAGGPFPEAWDDVTAALKGTGRVRLDDADRAALGARAERFPLLG